MAYTLAPPLPPPPCKARRAGEAPSAPPAPATGPTCHCCAVGLGDLGSRWPTAELGESGVFTLHLALLPAATPPTFISRLPHPWGISYPLHQGLLCSNPTNR